MTEEKSVSQRLVDAAEKCFCENGYDGTTVREIVKEANCNVAAVNYHFGGKDKLYIEMFRKHMAELFAKRKKVIKDVFASNEPTLEMLVALIAEDVIEDLKHRPHASAMHKMLIREMIDPHFEEPILEHDKFVEMESQVCDAISKLVTGIDNTGAMMGLFSMRGVFISMMLFHEIYELEHGKVLEINTVERLVKFICAGIRSLAK